MVDKHLKVLDKVCEELKRKKGVLGILLFGSLAKGHHHSYSDIDLFVIGEDEVHRTEWYYHDGIPVQIIWRSPELFKEKIMIKTRTYPISKSCKILYDKLGLITESVEKSKKAVGEKPVRLSEQELKMKHAELSMTFSTIKGLIDSGELASAVLLMNDLVYIGIELYYDLNHHYMVSKKHIIPDFKKHHSELGCLCESIVLEADIHKKLQELDVFRTRILELLGGSLDSYELYW